MKSPHTKTTSGELPKPASSLISSTSQRDSNRTVVGNTDCPAGPLPSVSPAVEVFSVKFKSELAPSRIKLKLRFVGFVPFQEAGPDPDAVGEGSTVHAADFVTVIESGGTQNVIDGNGPSIPTACEVTLFSEVPREAVVGRVHEVRAARALARPVASPLLPGRITNLQG